MNLIRLWWQGFSIVTLTAINVVMISGGAWKLAFVSGFGISWVWWRNAHSAAHDTVPGAQLAYAFGAACGTVTGMAIGRWLT